jgi:hypothetical protein
MRTRAILFGALFFPFAAAAVACSGDDTPAQPGVDGGGADATVDAPGATSDSGPGRDGGGGGDGGSDSAIPFDAGAITDPFCIAWKKYLDRCGQDSGGCVASNLTSCGFAAIFNDDYKSAAETCQPQIACDAGFMTDLDPCVKAKLAALPPTAAEQKFQDDVNAVCNPDSGVDAGPAQHGRSIDGIVTDMDTTCVPLLKTDAGVFGCAFSIVGCEVKVAQKYIPADACKDAGTD